MSSLVNPSYSWSASGDATIDQSGLLIAGASTGVANVQVCLTSSPSPCASAYILVNSSTSPGTPPTSYSVRTDRNLAPEPAPTVWGPAGTCQKDPTFGSLLCRITDPNTLGLGSDSGNDPSSAVSQAFSINSDWLYVQGANSGGTLVFQLNPATAAVTPSERIPSQGAGAFSWITDNKLFDESGGTFEVDVLTLSPGSHTSAKYVDFSSCPGINIGNSTAMSEVQTSNLDADGDGLDDRVATYVGGGQDHGFLVVVYDHSKGGCRALNTQTGAVTGAWGPTGTETGYPSGCSGIHNARMSKDGLYIHFDTNGCNQKDNYFWQIDTLNVYDCQFSAQVCDGHLASGAAPGGTMLVNMDGAFASTNTFDALANRVRPANNPAGWRDLIITPVLPQGIYDDDGHDSWNNSTNTIYAPVLITHFKASTAITRAWDDELIAVSTDPANPDVVWRFAHLFNASSDFTHQPRGNVSPDGCWFMFNSDFNGTLGRVDVFLVSLCGGV